MNRIIELANDLTQELIERGYNIQAKAKSGIIPDYLSFGINIFRNADGEKTIYVENIGQGWEVRGEYTGTGFQEVEE